MPVNFTHTDIEKVKADAIVNASDKLASGVIKLKKGGLFAHDTILISNTSGTKTVSTTLEFAKKQRYTSIAFPAFDIESVKVVLKACRKFLENNGMDITLVLPKKYSLDIWNDVNTYFTNMFVQNPLKNTDLDIVRRRDFSSAFENAHGFGRQGLDRHYAGNPEIDKLFKKMDISFSERLFMFIDERNMKDSEVYNAANISKQVFHKIRTSKNYRPKKTTVLALAIGLRLSLEETDELLRYAGYSFARNDKTDIILSYFISKEIYDIDLINITLYEYDLQLLGSK